MLDDVSCLRAAQKSENGTVSINADDVIRSGEPKEKQLLLCFSHLRWNFVYQRPQHLISRCAKVFDVIFFEEPVIRANTEPHLDVRHEAGVRIAVPVLPEHLSANKTILLQRQLIEELLQPDARRHPVLWYYTPMAIPFTRQLNRSLCIYDCMDELSAFKGAPEALRLYETELMNSADLVFTGGNSLYEAKKQMHPRVIAFPSSVDVDHFRKGRLNTEDPQDQAAIPKPRLGFYGVIDERFDVSMISAMAAARPDWHFVFVGPTVKIDPATLPRASNIHYLGLKTYAELPNYLAGWDIALLPFALNEATRYISPTKTPEYLAAGKPVISTPIHDVVQTYGKKNFVSIAENAGQAIVAAEKILAGRERSVWLKQVDIYLSQQSWDLTWAKMHAHMQALLHRPRTLERIPRIVPSTKIPDKIDYLVVGAGFAGGVLAERLANSGKQILVIDKRPHIAGNAYDFHDKAGILVHKYGPHIFHTNSAKVFDYLSKFTKWRHYEHRVLAHVDNQLLPIPINLDTVNKLYGLRLTSAELEQFLARRAERRDPVRTSEDVVINTVGRELYEKFFRGYTRKQWGLDPSQLDKSVTARIPTRCNRDDRYFTDKYQYMPLNGYTKLFENMLDHKNITVLTGVDYRDVKDQVPYDRMVYTGPIDEYFDFRYGVLPYRSLSFKHVTHDYEWHQPVGVVNYPQTQDYTRITEYKHLTGQQHRCTSLSYEYPTDDGDPYYPVPRPENADLYKKYEALADAEPNVLFVGRLATYRYYNMDQVVAQALSTFEKIARNRTSAAGFVMATANE